MLDDEKTTRKQNNEKTPATKPNWRQQAPYQKGNRKPHNNKNPTKWLEAGLNTNQPKLASFLTFLLS